MIRSTCLALLLVSALFSCPSNAFAQHGREPHVELVSATLPRPFLTIASSGSTAAPAVDRLVEASAVIVLDNPARFLVAHDKQSPLRIVDPESGLLAETLLSAPAFPNHALDGGKWEAMAQDNRGRIYLVGAHSGKTPQERTDRGFLLRFTLSTSNAPPAIDAASVEVWTLGEALVKVLGDFGLTSQAIDKRKIEGLAVRPDPQGGAEPQLVVGLREPDDLVRVLTLTLPANGEPASLNPLFAFAAGDCEGVPRQLTSLEYIPEWNGFLVITTTEDDDNVFHGNTLWYVSDAGIAAAKDGLVTPVEIATFEVAMKAEGLAVIPGTACEDVLEAVVVYDNDPKKTSIPSRYQRIRLERH